MKSLWKRSCVKTTDIRNFAGCSIHMRLGVLGKIIFRKHNGAMMIIKNKKTKENTSCLYVVIVLYKRMYA